MKNALKEYEKKRDFRKTTEPKGKISKNKSDLPIFVIQKHAASRLHYDLRLEYKKILKSWAVTKGPSLNPQDKRLSVMVEDHPYDYKDFEGTIPKGNYGAGTVIVWDHGYFYTPKSTIKKEIEKEFSEGLKKGKFSFIFEGEKVRGEFSLVKMHNDKTSWLLIKKKDQYASEKNILLKDQSVLSGKTIKDLGKKDVQDPDLSKFNLNKKSMPPPFKPMLCMLIEKPFDDKDWIYEVKWDGYRTLARIENKKITLFSRNMKTFNHKYPEIVDALKIYQNKSLILDGEIVVVDNQGVSQFQYLQNYHKNKEGRLIYCVFDLLYFDQYDLRKIKLIDRKAILKKIIPENSIIRFSDHMEEKGTSFFKAALENKLEGIVAKYKNSVYHDNKRSEDWLKIKSTHREEAIIAGFTKSTKGRKYFSSLILGLYNNNQLNYIGHCGTGFNEEEQQYLYKKFIKLETKYCPFQKKPKTNFTPHWLKPQLICEISFSGWTKDKMMRAPVYLGIREDKEPTEVKQDSSAENFPSESKNNFKLTHPNKIYFPDNHYRKIDIIHYYESIADYLLPYLKDRPQSLHRHPNGIHGENFFQKDIDFKVPDFVETFKIFSKSNGKYVNYVVCNNKETLLYLINLGCIEINLWLSRIQHIQFPDYAVFDLDPTKDDFSEVVIVANTIHRILSDIQVACYCKTSGATGLHIYIPLKNKYPYKTSENFVHLISQFVNAELGEITSLERSPKKRKNKVYLDYLQNRKGQTLVTPYSVRPRPGAPVSTPLHWDEVNNHLDPQQFTIKNTLRRIEQEGDIFKNILGKGINIEACIKKLERLLKSD